MRQRAAASLLYQSQYAEPAFRNLQKSIFLKIVGRILAFYRCICLESNEIMELDDYPVGLLLEDLSHCPKGTGIYFYDDDSQEYYGIYPDEIRTDEKGDVWIKVR